MTKHLPECPVGPGRMLVGVIVCQCEILRACEQRVLAAIDLPAANVQYHRVGFKEGLNAAREAVAAAVTHRGGYHSAAEYEAVAITAIDALRGEP